MIKPQARRSRIERCAQQSHVVWKLREGRRGSALRSGKAGSGISLARDGVVNAPADPCVQAMEFARHDRQEWRQQFGPRLF